MPSEHPPFDRPIRPQGTALLWTAALVVAALCLWLVPAQAEAALPLGFDIAAGIGFRGDLAEPQGSLDLRLRAEFRLGPIALGGSFRGLPKVLGVHGEHKAMGYGHIGLNLPIKKSRIILRVGAGGGAEEAGTPLFGVHEAIGIHFFAIPVVGIGLEADFDQTYRVSQETWNHGLSGVVLLLLRF